MQYFWIEEIFIFLTFRCFFFFLRLINYLYDIISKISTFRKQLITTSISLSSSKTFTTWWWPCMAAMCNGVWRSLFVMLGEQPAFNRATTASVWPFLLNKIKKKKKKIHLIKGGICKSSQEQIKSTHQVFNKHINSCLGIVATFSIKWILQVLDTGFSKKIIISIITTNLDL